MSFSYARSEKRSFVVAASRPYLACMENRELNYPTPEQLYALERAARVERSREIARLMSRAVAAMKNFALRAAPKGMRHA